MNNATLANVALAAQVGTLHHQKKKLLGEVGTLLGTLVAADEALKAGRVTEAQNIIHRELYKARELRVVEPTAEVPA